MSWKKAQKWERSWWGNCANTFGEEEKQLIYAKKMGLKTFHDGKSPYNFDVKGKKILDIGGGPCSILLKCSGINAAGVVVDPCQYPEWVKLRYKEVGIKLVHSKGEDIENFSIFDEVWIYNVLQHTDDPEMIIGNALEISKIIRIFEWIDTSSNEGHPHILKAGKLDKWLGGIGKVEDLNERYCKGRCYHGIFPTPLYTP